MPIRLRSLLLVATRMHGHIARETLNSPSLHVECGIAPAITDRHDFEECFPLYEMQSPTYAESVYASLPLRPHLREIRVVLLQPGSWVDTIACKLDVVALGAKPEFEAISYVWGSSDDVQSIVINGQHIQVTPNLVSALRCFRRQDRVRTLWVDAISINQRNVQERNEQVVLMRDIYFQCQRVLIWIGEATTSGRYSPPPSQWETDFSSWNENSEPDERDEGRISQFEIDLRSYYRLPFALRHSLAIDTIQGVYCLLSLLAQNKHVTNDDIPFLSNHDAFHRVILALSDLMNSSWWTRQWVVQEIVLPPNATIQYGSTVAHWDLFARAARNYDHHRKECCQNHYTRLHWNDIRILEHFSRTVVELDDLRQEWQKIRRQPSSDTAPQISLRKLLWQFRERDGSDPRDKVFSLFTLVNYWGTQTPMQPDYNWTTAATYRAVVEKVIDVDESLLVLIGCTSKTVSGLPTWVPDWTSKTNMFELERLERAQLFDASKGREPSVRFLGETFLELKAVPFDVIVDIAEEMDYSDEEETHRIFASWYSLVCKHQSMESTYVAGGTMLEAYWRTLCMDTARGLGREEASIDKGSRYRRCSKNYVKDGMKEWMDKRGLPIPYSDDEVLDVAGMQPGMLSPYGNASPMNRSGTSTPSRRSRSPVRAEPTFRERMNFVAVDFAVASAINKRRLFFTEKGYIGVGPAWLREQDKIYVFHGGQMPFSVRSTDTQEVPRLGPRHCSELVGDCYVHGIMDGELIDRNEDFSETIYLV